MKKIIFISLLFFLFLSSGCGQNLSGQWELSLNLSINNEVFPEGAIRIESLPVNIVLEQDKETIYILPAPYLNDSFRGKGHIGDGKVKLDFTSSEGFFFKDEIIVKALNLSFESSGDVSPGEDYIIGQVTGKLSVMYNGKNVDCDVTEGTLTLIKKKISN